jgi:hypothetical protein
LERLERINILPRGFIERIKVTDLSYLDAAQQPRFRLDELELDLAGGDLHLALAYGSLGLRMAGLRATLPGDSGDGAVNPLQALTPENLGLIASVERFPVQAWWRSVVNGLVLAAAAGEQSPETDAIGQAMGADQRGRHRAAPRPARRGNAERPPARRGRVYRRPGDGDRPARARGADHHRA